MNRRVSFSFFHKLILTCRMHTFILRKTHKLYKSTIQSKNCTPAHKLVSVPVRPSRGGFQQRHGSPQGDEHFHLNHRIKLKFKSKNQRLRSHYSTTKVYKLCSTQKLTYLQFLYWSLGVTKTPRLY